MLLTKHLTGKKAIDFCLSVLAIKCYDILMGIDEMTLSKLEK